MENKDSKPENKFAEVTRKAREARAEMKQAKQEKDELIEAASRRERDASQGE